jgi:hypothetical protein
VLAPTLCGWGRLVVMDNLWANKAHRGWELLEVRGCELLLYLPPNEAPPDL